MMNSRISYEGIYITHPNAAAAPRRAYVPGVMHGASGWHTANIPDWG